MRQAVLASGRVRRREQNEFTTLLGVCARDVAILDLRFASPLDAPGVVEARKLVSQKVAEFLA